MSKTSSIDTTYRILIPSEDIGRSTSDILHNVITRLNMSNYYSKRVTIFERPIRAEIIFRKINRLPAHMRTVSGRFQQKNQKRHDQFTLYVIINKGDAFGLNNILDYRFDVQELHAEEKHKVSKDIHQMIKNAYGVTHCFPVIAAQ